MYFTGSIAEFRAGFGNLEGPMEAGRLNAYEAAPDAMRAVQQVEAYIQRCGLEKSLIDC